jgi:hypothetical protein
MTGFRGHRQLGSGEVFWLPGDPGVAFTRNKRYALSNGVLVAATDSVANAIFRPIRTVTMAAASVAFTKPRDLDPAAATHDTTLVPCVVDCPAGLSIQRGKVKNYADETVVSYTASTRAIACTTGFTADDYPNGALLIVTGGPGVGEWNVIEDYDHTGGAAELLLICHRKFSATLTTSTTFTVLAPTDANNGLGLWGRCDLADDDELDVSDGDDDGDYVITASWQDLYRYGRLGHLPYSNVAPIYT